MQGFLQLQECDGELTDRSRIGRYVGHDDCGTTCIILDEKTKRVFNRGLAEILECLDEAQKQMNKLSDISIKDLYSSFFQNRNIL